MLESRSCLQKVFFIKYDDKEKIATVKGVDQNFYNVSRIEPNIAAGKPALIENGIKYNQSNKPVVVVSHQVNDEFLELRFEDNGIGIEEEYREKVFQFFKRLHGSTEYEGTGIGLGLCKKIVQNYNGIIFVKALEKGGSVFIIQFPKSLVT